MSVSLPRRVARAVRRRLFQRPARPLAPIVFTGDYASWDEAKAASDGYESSVILDRTTAALLKVKRGDAVYERDYWLQAWDYMSGKYVGPIPIITPGPLTAPTGWKAPAR